MNILSFDIEEWYLQKNRFGDSKSKYNELNSLLKQILDLLDSRKMKGTFFCLGGMASDFPDVVKMIDSKGHEIGCHSNKHIWLNKMSCDEIKEDTRISVDALEQCIGKKVKSYRAPAFSIGENNMWVFEILANYGIERDASIFPAKRDFGGFPKFGYKNPVIIDYHGVTIKEFPICTIKLFGRNMAYSGGGYFRFFPLRMIRRELKNASYAMTYFHMADLLVESEGVMTREAYEDYFKEPGTFLARYTRYFKANFGKNTAKEKLFELINTTDFTSMEYAEKTIDWNLTPRVII